MLSHDFEKELEKIEETCRENNLEFDFKKASFPIIATIRPDQESRNQIMMDLGEGLEVFKSGEIALIFGDELTMSIIDGFTIEDRLLNKFKNQAKKLHYIYLQMYFKQKTKMGVK